MKPNDITKLPTWAQQHIASLESRLESDRKFYENAVVEMKSQDPLIKWEYAQDEHGIPSDARVVFTLKHGTIEFRLYDDYIEAHADSSYGSEIIVQPRASNGLNLRLIKDN